MGLVNVSPLINSYKVCENYTVGAGESAKFYFNGKGYGSVVIHGRIDEQVSGLPWAARAGVVYDDNIEGYNWVRDYVDKETGAATPNNGSVIIGYNLTMDNNVIQVFNKDGIAHNFTFYIRLYPYPFGNSNQNYIEGVPFPF